MYIAKCLHSLQRRVIASAPLCVVAFADLRIGFCSRSSNGFIVDSSIQAIDSSWLGVDVADTALVPVQIRFD